MWKPSEHGEPCLLSVIYSGLCLPLGLSNPTGMMPTMLETKETEASVKVIRLSPLPSIVKYPGPRQSKTRLILSQFRFIGNIFGEKFNNFIMSI